MSLYNEQQAPNWMEISAEHKETIFPEWLFSSAIISQQIIENELEFENDSPSIFFPFSWRKCVFCVSYKQKKQPGLTAQLHCSVSKAKMISLHAEKKKAQKNQTNQGERAKSIQRTARLDR